MNQETAHDNRWIDSHAHLTMFDRAEIPSVLRRAEESGVFGVLVPATSPDDLHRALNLAEEYPNRIVAAVGVHPHDATALDSAHKNEIVRVLANDGVIAVGEIGLDYHYMNSPKEDQLAACEWQLDLALDVGLPVVLHNRESWSDLERLLSRRSPALRGVCHSFAEGPAEARRVIELGLMVGISGMVTFKAAHNIREMVAALLPSDVMIETDSPFLAPTPHRGKRNEPAYVRHTGGRLAVEWRIEPERVSAETSANFRKLFSVKSDWADGVGSGSAQT